MNGGSARSSPTIALARKEDRVRPAPCKLGVPGGLRVRPEPAPTPAIEVLNLGHRVGRPARTAASRRPGCPSGRPSPMNHPEHSLPPCRAGPYQRSSCVTNPLIPRSEVHFGPNTIPEDPRRFQGPCRSCVARPTKRRPESFGPPRSGITSFIVSWDKRQNEIRGAVLALKGATTTAYRITAMTHPTA